MKSIKSIILLIFSVYLNSATAQPFDETGLINLRSAGTKRGTCWVIGSRLVMPTNQLGMELQHKKTKNQDEYFFNLKKRDEMFYYGKKAGLQANRIGDYSEMPPSERKDFSEMSIKQSKFDEITRKDPWAGIRAWNTCQNYYFQ